MKELVKKALDEAIKKLAKQIPLTKKAGKRISIEDVRPIDISDFMAINNIPDDAVFSNTEEGFFGTDTVLYWDIDVPTTEKDNLAFRKKRFEAISWKYVYDLLLANGYKRVGFSSSLLKEFGNTTMYEMFLNKEFDKITRRYSLSFKKIEVA